MSGSWGRRKTRLDSLLAEDGDEDAKSLALDRILHGQSVIGRTAKTAEIEELRFGDKDLNVLGTLEYGQYGVIDVATCKLDGKTYVRKSVEKKSAVKTQDQCSPQTERDILLSALKSKTRWAPHLLCAFQTTTHLSLVMEYVEGGTLWDVLESSPLEGRISEDDLHWWAPQMVSAVHWCHSQGFVHRDVKPHNFVLTPDALVKLIDFGSAAPLLAPDKDGSQQVPKRHTLVPCGTCDYISPEILRCHEEALVALEMSDDPHDITTMSDHEPGGYGRETDWWSLGAMLYEMVYGVAPFFANDIRQTYLKIMDHQHSLRFHSSKVQISPELQDLLKRLLNTAELRLGRSSVQEIMTHPFFKNMKWDALHDRIRPSKLHLPQFTYMSTPAEPAATAVAHPEGESNQNTFAFSMFFQSSPFSAPGSLLLQPTPSKTPGANKSILRESSTTSFIGFSWGPTRDAFKDDAMNVDNSLHPGLSATPHLRQPTTPLSSKIGLPGATPQLYPFMTPVRPIDSTPFQTLPRASTVRRTVQRRAVSDREAMKQLVSLVGMSARKKVLESGRKPRILTSGKSSRTSTLKELRFDRSVMVVNADSGVSYRMDPTTTTTTESVSLRMSGSLSGTSSSVPAGLLVPTDSDISTESDAPWSPSPSPRPGSALSMMSKRSQTPTVTSFNLLQPGHRRTSSTDSKGRLSPTLPHDLTWPSHTTGGGRSVTPMDEALSDDALDDLQKRHDRLMQDIHGMCGRLEEITLRIGGRS